MKVLFLDIDGVMNSRVFYETRYKNKLSRLNRLYNLIKSKIKFIFNGFKKLENKTPKDHYTYKYQFKRLRKSTCPEKWQWLAEFCNENNYKICISSVWKNHFGTKNKIRLDWWDQALIDLGFKEGTFVGITGDRRTLRGQEIKEWLDRHEIENYAVLDDDSDMLEEQFNHFFHSDPWFGLNPNHLYRIKRHFDNKSNYKKVTKTLDKV